MHQWQRLAIACLSQIDNIYSKQLWTLWFYKESIFSVLEDEKSTDNSELRLFGKGLALGVAYGANAGGIATLTGTPPNLILQGQANE